MTYIFNMYDFLIDAAAAASLVKDDNNIMIATVQYVPGTMID